MSIQRKERLLSKLHYFIFGATIVGETVVQSLIISDMGPAILPKLNFVNGILLFLLPALFFSKIDKINRGDLFRKTLKYAALIVLAVFFLYQFSSLLHSDFVSKGFLLLLYPISYLLKTVLFLSFWSVATDISDAVEAKRIFPSVAAFGFMGGLTGSVLSRFLLSFVDAIYILLFWFALYILALYSMKSFVRLYKRQLIPLETLPTSANKRFAILDSIKLIFKMPLVRNIANLYFTIFITIFVLDFFFWSMCNTFYDTPSKLASFQFTFISFHSVITILSLRYFTPDHVNEKGFTSVFSYLPKTLFTGALLFTSVYFISGRVITGALFGALIVWQVLRYVVFENFFSPVYQMFFATMEPEIRGRAKTVIEGIVKPSAIIVAAMIQYLFSGSVNLLLISILVSAAAMIWVSSKIKKVYVKSLVEGSVQVGTKSESLIPMLASRLGSSDTQSVLTYMKSFDEFSTDVKRFFVNLMVHMNHPAVEALVLDIARRERDKKIRMIIATHCGNFHGLPQTEIADLYIDDEDEEVRTALLASFVRKMVLLQEYRDTVWARFVLAKSEREKFYSVMYISRKGKRGDKGWAKSYMKSLLVADSTERQKEYGLLGNLSFDSSYSDSVIDYIGNFSLDTLGDVLNILLKVLPKSDIEKLVGKFAYSASGSRRRLFLSKLSEIPPEKLPGVSRYIVENRTSPLNDSLVRVLAEIRAKYPKGTQEFPESELYGVRIYAQKLCESAYLHAAIYHVLTKDSLPLLQRDAVFLMEEALHEELIRAANVVFDALVILEGLPYLIRARNEFSLRESSDKSTLIELIELLPSSSLKDMLIPILEESEWSTYHAVGQRFFSIKPDSVVFLTSEDVWLTAVGLYWHYLNFPQHQPSTAVKKRVQVLIKHTNSLISNAARGLQDLWKGEIVEESGFDILSRVLFLKKSELFSKVPAHSLVTLAESMQLVTYVAGDTISEEGNVANHLYLVKSGVVELRKKSILLWEIAEGGAYGEAGLFCSSIRSQSAVAKVDCEIFVVNKASLKKLIAVNPSLAVSLLSVFGTRMQEKDEVILGLREKIGK